VQLEVNPAARSLDSLEFRLKVALLDRVNGLTHGWPERGNIHTYRPKIRFFSVQIYV
jgi:hypothetical protein